MRTLLKFVVVALVVCGFIDGGAAVAASKPSAPQSAMAISGNQFVKVSWTAPLTNGGANVDKYAVQQLSSSTWSTVGTVGSGVRSWTTSGLTNGTKYYFRVKAHNSIGWSPVSARVSATPSTVPSAPVHTRVTPDDTTATLTWEVPTNGGAPINKYRVAVSTDGQTFGSVVTTTLPTKTLTGLTPGTEYWFRVQAHNVRGYGPAAGVGPRVAMGVPGVPVVSGIAGDGEIELKLDAAPAAKYSPVDFYELDALYPGGEWMDLDYRIASYAEDDGAVWQIQGLTNTSSYSFRVRAHNEAGYGPFTEVQTFTPTGPPTAPVDVTGHGTVNGMHVEWSVPESNGGSPIDNYEVSFMGTLSNWTATTTTLSLDQSTGDTGDFFSIRVRAHSAKGWGPYSDAIEVLAGASN